MSRSLLHVELRTSPHLRQAPSVEQIMRNVIYALLPVAAFAIWQFGLSALSLIITVTAATVGTEALFNRLAGKASTVNDYSAIITGLLLALTLPPGFPLWMGAVGGFVAIALGKVLFGGLGYNVFNPALVGRAFVQAAFPAAITGWTPAYLDDRFTQFIPTTLTLPFMTPPALDGWLGQVAPDALTGATPLADWKFAGNVADSWQLFLGMGFGSAGEVPALLILAGGAWLIARRMMDWRIPTAVILGTGLTSGVFWLLDPGHYPSPLFMILSGGLLLGAFFMASDMVASPVTPKAIWIYGLFIGLVTVIIRLFGGLPEGVMYAILLGNALAPLIEQVTQPRVYGQVNRRAVRPPEERS